MAATESRLDIPVRGMTCSSCAARVEKGLNGIEGVEATVNFATEHASLTFDPDVVDPSTIVEKVESIGYRTSLPEDEPGDSAERAGDDSERDLSDLRRRLAVSAALTLPIFLVAMIPALQFDYWQWVSFALATPVVWWAGLPFHRMTWQSLKHGATNMDTLISLGTITAFTWSAVALVFGDAGSPEMRMEFSLIPDQGAGSSEIYFEIAAVVITFLLAGRYFETRGKRDAGAALRSLLELGVKEVSVLEADGSERRIGADELVPGQLFIVRPGEKLAADGEVVEGVSAIDQSLLTGEAVPVDVGPGDRVTGATVNRSGRLLVRATQVGADSTLSQIGRMVTEAQTGKADVQRLADRISGVFVPIVIVLAVATLGFWLGSSVSTEFAITTAVAVMIVACPCALGLATPTALLAGTGRGAQLGLLIKGPEVLESTQRIDTVVLDKTGTVTTGQMSLERIITAESVDEIEALMIAGAVEDASEHPIARAIADAAFDRLGALPSVRDFRNLEGMGVEAELGGLEVLIGRRSLVESRGMKLLPALARAVADADARGRTAVVAAWRGRPRAVFEIGDRIKPSSRAAVRRLAELGLRPVLLTGDNQTTADAVALEVGIVNVIAEVLPSQKAEVIRNLQADGSVVAMVGDGVNDAPALAQADLGLAIGTGTDVAIEASDLTLMSGDLYAAADAIELSRTTLKTIKQNLFWAFGYNVAAIPLAIAGFLNPIVAGAAMALSSVFVLTNSLRLRAFSPTTHTDRPKEAR